MSERVNITHITKIYGGKHNGAIGFVSYKAEGKRITSNCRVYLDANGLYIVIKKERYYLRDIRKQIPKERGGAL